MQPIFRLSASDYMTVPADAFFPGKADFGKIFVAFIGVPLYH